MLAKRFWFKIMLENHYPQPPFSGLCGDPWPVLPSPILHLTFRTAPPDGCHAARRSQAAARGL